MFPTYYTYTSQFIKGVLFVFLLLNSKHQSHKLNTQWAHAVYSAKLMDGVFLNNSQMCCLHFSGVHSNPSMGKTTAAIQAIQFLRFLLYFRQYYSYGSYGI